MGRVIRHPSRVTPFFKRNAELFTSSKSAVAKVIHIGCGELPRASSPMLNNFWISYKGQGEGGIFTGSHSSIRQLAHHLAF
jgi:hypothetical protein